MKKREIIRIIIVQTTQVMVADDVCAVSLLAHNRFAKRDDGRRHGELNSLCKKLLRIKFDTL